MWFGMSTRPTTYRVRQHEERRQAAEPRGDGVGEVVHVDVRLRVAQPVEDDVRQVVPIVRERVLRGGPVWLVLHKRVETSGALKLVVYR